MTSVQQIMLGKDTMAVHHEQIIVQDKTCMHSEISFSTSCPLVKPGSQYDAMRGRSWHKNGILVYSYIHGCVLPWIWINYQTVLKVSDWLKIHKNLCLESGLLAVDRLFFCLEGSAKVTSLCLIGLGSPYSQLQCKGWLTGHVQKAKWCKGVCELECITACTVNHIMLWFTFFLEYKALHWPQLTSKYINDYPFLQLQPLSLLPRLHWD